jgi:hypothetical protein
MKPADEQLLHDAIARNAGAVVSLPSAGMLRHHKTRLLASEDDGFWIEAPPGESALIQALITSAQPVGISLKSAMTKLVLAAPARAFRAAMQINRDTAVDAVQLCWPGQIKAVQRRADYRVTVLRDSEISVRVWRIPEHHVLRDKPLSAAELKVTLRDLSVGGMKLICVPVPGVTKVVADQRLRMAFRHPDGEVIVEGRVRHAAPLPNGDLRLGVQFKKLEDAIQGRQALATLTTIVGQLQREEIRRHRLGIMKRPA